MLSYFSLSELYRKSISSFILEYIILYFSLSYNSTKFFMHKTKFFSTEGKQFFIRFLSKLRTLINIFIFKEIISSKFSLGVKLLFLNFGIISPKKDETYLNVLSIFEYIIDISFSSIKFCFSIKEHNF